MAEAAHDPFLRPLSKLISLLGVSSHCIIEVMNPLHDVPDASKHWFAIYHPHNKDKFVGNPTRALVCGADNLYFLSNFGNLSASLKRDNRRELPYIFFLIFSNLRLYFSARRSPKCARRCLNTW